MGELKIEDEDEADVDADAPWELTGELLPESAQTSSPSSWTSKDAIKLL
jgi:hypothetical protein